MGRARVFLPLCLSGLPVSPWKKEGMDGGSPRDSSSKFTWNCIDFLTFVVAMYSDP